MEMREGQKKRYEYAKKLIDEIINAFKGYGLDFNWSAGGLEANPSLPIVYDQGDRDPIVAYDDDDITGGEIGFKIFAPIEDDPISHQIMDSDVEVFKRFVNDIVENFIRENKEVSCYADRVGIKIMNKYHDGKSYPGILVIVELGAIRK